jgi:hypothetical protein
MHAKLWNLVLLMRGSVGVVVVQVQDYMSYDTKSLDEYSGLRIL